MKKLCIILSTLFILFISCTFNSTSSNSDHKKSISKDTLAPSKSLNLSIKPSIDTIFPDLIKVNYTLYNTSDLEICFLSRTCDEIRNLLRYDTSLFTLAPMMMCNASFWRVECIGPKSGFSSSSYFQRKHFSNSLKLGFNFITVPRDLDLKAIEPSYYYEANSAKIIWANEVMIDNGN